MSSVLIVDDSELARQRAKEPLEAVGYEVRQAGSGAQALDLVDETPPDAILLNVQMPDTGVFEVMDGLEARGSDIPVVVATAQDDEETARAFLERGAVDFLSKDPFYGTRVVNAIHRGIVLGREEEVRVSEDEPGRVLLLDDSPVIRRLVREILDDAAIPIAIDEVQDAERALELAREKDYDVLLIDHVLPGMDGADLLGLLRDEGVQTPALALTGRRDPELANRFLAAGAYGIWTKEHEGPLRLRVSVEHLVRLNRVVPEQPTPPTVPA